MDVKPGNRRNTHKAALGLLAARRAHVEQLAHDQAQVASHGGNQVSLLDLFDAAQPTSSRTARLADVSEAPFHTFTPQTLQSLAPRPTRATTIAHYRATFLLGHIFPVTPAVSLPPRLGNVRAEVRPGRQFQGVRGMVALVCDRLFDLHLDARFRKVR